LGWVAFASVNVMFKDRIIAAKDHRYQAMQATYENRVTDLQLSYDELQGALVSAEDKFKAVADELQTKQQTVASLRPRKQTVDLTLSGLAGGTRGALDNAVDIPRASKSTASDSIGSDVSEDGGGNSELRILPDPAPAQPRTAHPTRASFLDDTVGKLAG